MAGLAGTHEAAGRHGFRGSIATAPAADPARGYDFVSRYFAPAGGIPEDPVTGSAHTALAPYWSHRLGRVHLTGHAVTILDGTLHHTAG